MHSLFSCLVVFFVSEEQGGTIPFCAHACMAKVKVRSLLISTCHSLVFSLFDSILIAVCHAGGHWVCVLLCSLTLAFSFHSM
mmetsp:Transcript_34332/g.88761  ORF Transcript_34332/g.88761 Transcript_34332/m.88761 type:complete len:82 (+) Transcript_34332:2077-2322(+)